VDRHWYNTGFLADCRSRSSDIVSLARLSWRYGALQSRFLPGEEVDEMNMYEDNCVAAINLQATHL